MEALETQRLTDDRNLLDEAIHFPERLVGGTIGPSAAELVVEDDGAPIGETGEFL
jgi:hypothetical protein